MYFRYIWNLVRVPVAGKADVNFLFDRYISTKTELRSTTYSNYLYTWNHFIRDTFGKKKVKDVKYSDVLFFYTDLINNQGLQINTIVKQFQRARSFLDLHLMMELRMRERFFQEYMLFMSQRNLLERHYWQS